MKKNKKLYIISLVIFCLGLVVFGVAFAMADFNFKNFKTMDSYVNQTYEVNVDEVNDITINDKSAKLSVVKNVGDKITVQYEQNDKEKYECTNNDNKLLVKFVDTRKWYEYVYSNFEERNVILSIPESYNKPITIKVSNNDVEIEDISIVGNLNVITANGSITLTNVNVSEELICKTSNDPIVINNVDCSKGTITSSNG